MKRFITVGLFVLMLSVVIGCSKSSGSGGKREVVVYSPNNPEINNPVMKKFEEETGIDVQLITSSTGELMKRIEAESANPLGDVFYGGGAESHDSIKEYLEPYVSKEKDNINSQFLDEDGIWTPQFVFPQVIMYNTELIPEGEEPQGWEDLLDEKWKGKIAFADPNQSGSSYAQLITMITAFGKDDEKGWEFIEKLVENIDGKLLSGSTMAPKGVADKEFAIAITPEDNALRYIQNGANVGVVYPVEGTSLRSDGNSIIKGAKNMDEAQEFIDFISSEYVHNLGQEEFLRRSTRKDMDPLEGSIATDDLTMLPYDSEWANSEKDEVIKRFNKIVTGQK